MPATETRIATPEAATGRVAAVWSPWAATPCSCLESAGEPGQQGSLTPADLPPDARINTAVDVRDLAASPVDSGGHRLDFDGMDFRTALNLVAAGLGVALPPRLLLVNAPPSVVVRPLREPTVVRRLYTCRLDTRRVDDHDLPGVHQIHTWDQLRRLITLAGDGGMVLTMPEHGRGATVYMSSAGRTRHIADGPHGVTTTPWETGNTLLEDPPRWAVSINKCADPQL
jgi:hypothetical protein